MLSVAPRVEQREIFPGGLNAVRPVVRVRLRGRRWHDVGKRIAASILVFPDRSDRRDDVEIVGFGGLLRPERCRLSRWARNCWWVFLVVVHPTAYGESPPSSQPEAITAEQQEYFETKIRPVLVEHCYQCHSVDADIVQGGLRIDYRDGLLRGGDSGPAVVPGVPARSLLIAALRHDGLEMPPKGRLSDEVIRDFEAWITMGVPDPRVAVVTPLTRQSDTEAGRNHWAFNPVQAERVPDVHDRQWPLQPCDNFILARLESEGLKPVEEADRYTWLRRVTLDLTGLIPSPEAIADFQADQSPMAYERVVDRLLASPSYGERWARHWMDLTGYADQVGTSNDIFAEHAWRYRDYLINAWKTDKPFDRFVRQQIAGDLLPYETAAERYDNLVATGFLVLGDVEVVNPDKLKLETDLIDRQVSKIGQTFLGMTLGCARCHDHKFDPIDSTDYYALAGIFRNTLSAVKIPNGIWSGINVVELPEPAQVAGDRQRRLTKIQSRLAELKAERSRLEAERASIDEQLKQPGVDTAVLSARRDQIAGVLQNTTGELEHAEFFAPVSSKGFAVQEGDYRGDMPIYVRGNPYAPGATVPRGFPKAISWSDSPAMPGDQSGRLQLADWLVDPRHPLTARVAVNRIWQKLFGVGIVRSVDYFGVRGELPSHPELLDHLAQRFMRDGWSQKRLIRSLVLSRTYRLSSRPGGESASVDPENRWYWRMNQRRLDAESIRDSMLAASGQLLSCDGGPALPLEYRENTGNLQPMAVNPPSFGIRRYRPEQPFVRTVYLPVIRSAQPGPARLRDFFDFTQPAETAGQRSQTVTATQSLYLMNNELPRGQAKALAQLILAGASSREERLMQLWLRTLSRPITVAEREQASEMLDEVAKLLQSEGSVKAEELELTAWTELVHAVLSSNEFLFRL